MHRHRGVRTLRRSTEPATALLVADAGVR